MYFLSWSYIWISVYFFSITYILLIFSLILYIVPIFSISSSYKYKSKITNYFYILSGLELSIFFFLPLIYVFILNLLWSSPIISIWFGHLVFTSFQYKIIYLVFFFFYLVLYSMISTIYFSSNEVYDFFLTKFNFLYWITFLFFSNSFFTVIFIVEVLSTLIFLLLVTSTFSSSFFYRNINLDFKFFFQNSIPYSFLNSIIFLFWISLVSSLNLFVFLIYIYTSLVTFDWFLLEHIFSYFILVSSTGSILSLGFSWFFLIFSIFLKCGIAPLFFWKPTFFKGINFQSLFFYIVFFYFFLFIFIVYFLTIYMHEIFYYYSIIIVVFNMLGLFTLFFILCESFYLKTFFAVSSILNSLLVFLLIVPSQNLCVQVLV